MSDVNPQTIYLLKRVEEIGELIHKLEREVKWLRADVEMMERSLKTEDRVAHRAAVEAGYADLSDYIKKWGDL